MTDWLRRWSGRRTFERIWLPLLKSKLGDNYRLASASFIWAIIARMYAARRSGLKREMFGYVEGGYDTVLRRFAERLEDSGVEIACGQPVAQRRRTPHDGAEVTLADGTAGVSTGWSSRYPARGSPALCPQLTDAEREQARPRGLSGHRVRVAAHEAAAGRLLRHQHHGRLGSLHRRDRDDRAGGSCALRRQLARVPAAIPRAG